MQESDGGGDRPHQPDSSFLMIVVSDTSPICYLLLIGEIDLLPQLYGQVLIFQIVQQELADERSPTVMQAGLVNHQSSW